MQVSCSIALSTPGPKKPLFGSFTRNAEIEFKSCSVPVKILFKIRTLWEGCLSNRTFEWSFLSVEFFHAYMKSSMPLPQRYRVKGIIQSASKTFLKSSRSYSRCKTTITPIIPNRTFFIHGCSESMMVT